SLTAYDLAGRPIQSTSLVTQPWIDHWVSLQAPGIHSFAADAVWWIDPNDPPEYVHNSPHWGMHAIEFQPRLATPEPGGLGLLLLGALGLIVRGPGRAVSAVVCLALAAGTSRADLITVEFTGTITSLEGGVPGGPTGGRSR